ncbi:transposase [Micromonospora sp. DR5-3]|uniref:RNA-guided endonuclease TnpB family protein n=1 Tax=unclassified Micromonospora TaxID=2617518 RepID=UPI0011DAAB69|nr:MULTISPECIES: RNA-guided endonuclease TnpB family protein [unclassified Micromonospora]MCW3813250.1 transposase [Micromonospora sp. DR5-3]TYC24643.1 transposase [Micromonospora sp. MP36]
MKVTRIAYSTALNRGKYAGLVEQARRLGRVRSQVWQRYGSIHGVGSGLRDRQVRDRWLADGTHLQFGLLANAWKETVRDAMADIAANMEAAKVEVRRAICRRTKDLGERKRMFTALKADQWASDPFLARQMRKHWKRGRNRTHDQIVVRADNYNTVVDGRGRLWLAVPGLEPRKMVKIPLSTTVAPRGTLRLILRGERVEVHYQIDASQMRSSQRPCGEATVGVDKGYTEALTDSDGAPYGEQLGLLLASESDRLKVRNRRRAKLRSIANAAALRGDHPKAHRIKVNNLGAVKRDRQAARHRVRVRTEIFTAVHEVVDKAGTVVAEDLTKRFTGRKKLPKNINRRLAAWTKGVTAEALKSVSERRGSALVPVNAAYTSQTCHRCGDFGRRSGDRFHCTRCGVVWQADVNAAINILHRAGDPDIALHTPHQRVKQILQDRTDRHRTRLPVQDSSPALAERRANYPNRSAMSNE